MCFRPLFALLCLATSVLAQAPVLPQPFGEAATRTFPFSMTGKLVFAQGDDWFQGSGTVVRPSSVLTAAHNLWDSERGFSTDVIFRRAFYEHPAVRDVVAARLYVMKGYREKAKRLDPTDARTFSDDLGGIVFAAPVAAGAHAGWWANPTLLTGAKPGVALGYGAEKHDGSLLLAVSPEAGFEPVVESFFANRTLNFESGMSGGPVFTSNGAGALTLAGVVVAGAVDSTSGGIRVLDEKAAGFIRAFLR